MNNVKLLHAGEQGLVVEFGDAIDIRINRRVCLLGKILVSANIQGVIEVVPTYRSIFVYFDPLVISWDELGDEVRQLLPEGHPAGKAEMAARIIDIPVCYGGEFGPDMGFVASHTGLSMEEVVEIHTAVPYLIYMLGFTPGFPYLGGLPERLAVPRLEIPRTTIAAGSVGIAGLQTGFYPVVSPGGWRIIGRTPVRAFNIQSEQPFLFSAGDYLRFRSITPEEFEFVNEQVSRGTYIPKSEVVSLKEGGVQ